MYSPKTSRIAPQTSPIEASAARAARIGCRRLPSPRATSRRDSSLASTAAWSRLSLKAFEPRQLALLGLGVDAEDVDVVDLVGDVLVDADDDVLAALVALVVAERRLLDLALHELQRLDRAAELFDLVHQLPGASSISSVSDSTK